MKIAVNVTPAKLALRDGGGEGLAHGFPLSRE